MINLLWVISAFFLVLLNAFFVAAEFGMVKLRHTRVATIKKTYGLRGKILSQIHKNLDAYLSACQLGITLASLGLGWVGEPAFASLLEPLFIMLGIQSKEFTVVISFILAFSILSFLHIVVGELVPKSLALRQSEKVSVWTAIPLYLFYWVMYPAIWILNFCSNAILKMVHFDKINKRESTYSPEEIKLILHATHIHGQLSKDEVDILSHSLEFLELEVSEVMRPIDEMIMIEANSSIKQAIDAVLKYRYSRYPIYYENTKEIIGIVHVKDVLLAFSKDQATQTIKSIMRPVLKVSRRLSAVDLLNKFQEGMPHFALVYKRADAPIGFLTLDNLFQVLVGRVRDEFHKIDESWSKNADGSYLMNSNNSLYILERALKIDIELDEETERTSDTIYGLILTKLGRLPHENERIEFDDFSILIKKMKGHKVVEVIVYPKKYNTR